MDTAWLARLFFISLSLAASTIAAARAEPVKVDLAYIPYVSVAQLYVMNEEGWTKDAGLNVETTKFRSGPAMVQALASGKFDGVYVAASPVVVARAAGVNLKIVAANGVEPSQLMGLGPLSAAFARAKTPAEAFALFRKEQGHAAKIGALPKGTILDTALRHYLKINKVPEDDAEIASIGGEDQLLQGLLAKAIDGAVIPEPLLTIVHEKNPEAKVVATGKQLMAGHPGFVLALRESFIKEHPEAAAKLVALHNRATDLIRKDPIKAGKDAYQYIGKDMVPEYVMVAALISPYNPMTFDPKATIEGTEYMQNFQMEIGAQPKKVPTADLFDFSFNDAAKGGR